MWVTRFRRQVLVPGVDRYLHVKLQEVRRYSPDWEYVAIGMEPDHVHLHMGIPPKDAVSRVVETLKRNTSRALVEKVGFLRKVSWDEDGIWTKGYGVSTVGANAAIIRRDVEMPSQEDAGQA